MTKKKTQNSPATVPPKFAVALAQVSDHSRAWSGSHGTLTEPISVLMGSHLAIAADARAKLLVFPESFPFWQHSVEQSAAIESLQAFSKEVPGHVPFVAGGLVNTESGMRNLAVLVSDGAVSEPYYKFVPWENEPIAHGPFGPVAWLVDGRRVGVMICSDLCGDKGEARHSERLQANFQKQRTDAPIDLLVVPAYAVRHYPHGDPDPVWSAPLASAAQALSCPVVFCTAGGNLPGQSADGGSCVVFPDGRVLGGQREPGLIVVDVG